MSRRVRALLLSAILIASSGLLPIVGAASVARAEQAAYCGPGEDAQLSPRISPLATVFPDVLGDATECPHLDAGGTEIQNTSTGIGFYFAEVRVPIFSTGPEYWAIGPSGPVHGVNDGSDLLGQVLNFSTTPAQPAAAATVVAPLMPIAPTATPEAIYQTRKGPRTALQLLNELSAAGYTGPWELSAMLAAYERANAPTPTPVATPVPPPAIQTAPNYSGACFQIASTLSLEAAAKIGPRGLGFTPQLIDDSCLSYARQDGTQGITCAQFAMRQEIDFVALVAAARLTTPVTPPSIDGLYAGCMGR